MLQHKGVQQSNSLMHSEIKNFRKSFNQLTKIGEVEFCKPENMQHQQPYKIHWELNNAPQVEDLQPMQHCGCNRRIPSKPEEKYNDFVL